MPCLCNLFHTTTQLITCTFLGHFYSTAEGVLLFPFSQYPHGTFHTDFLFLLFQVSSRHLSLQAVSLPCSLRDDTCLTNSNIPQEPRGEGKPRHSIFPAPCSSQACDPLLVKHNSFLDSVPSHQADNRAVLSKTKHCELCNAVGKSSFLE